MRSAACENAKRIGSTFLVEPGSAAKKRGRSGKHGTDSSRVSRVCFTR